MSKQPDDHLERERIRTELDTTFVVEAAAGTGKTTMLVERIVNTVKAGRASLSELIAVTFTEKAAGEMKLRLRAKLDDELRHAQTDDERRLLTEALEALEVARISTIHGLCADLLREYPVESGVDPLFEVCAEGDAEAMLHAAFTREFQRMVRQPPEGVRRVLRRRARGWDAEPPRLTLRHAVSVLIEHRDFPTPWRRDPFDRDGEIEALVGPLTQLGFRCTQLTERTQQDFCRCLELVNRFVEDLVHRESPPSPDQPANPRDYDGIEAQLRELVSNQYLWTKAPWRNTAFHGVTTEQVVAEQLAVYEQLKQFVRRADADVAALLHRELQVVVEAYEEEKARAGVLDFVDLLLKTRDLLCNSPQVRALLQQRFRRLFVDEFQDTDPLQSEILLLLAAADPAQTQAMQVRPVPGKLFVVGDPKQSIYRFRRADVLLYERVKKHLESHGAATIYLSTSFRSTPGIQAAINASFADQMSGGYQPKYVALGQWRERRSDQPSLIAIPAPHPFGNKGWPTKAAAEASLSEAVGAFIEWLVKHSGWSVEEGRRQVPIEARHICILFKRLRKWGGGDVPRPYAQALEARGVRHVLVGGRSFHVREEVMALRTALWAIERPDDELSIYATLKGPFFAFTDDQLFGFRHQVKKGRAFHAARRFDRADFSPESLQVVDALAALGTLHRERNARPVAATLHEFLELTRAHAGVAFWTAGAQALANVLQLAELSRRHERRATSFRDVVEALQEEADEGEAPEAPIVEEGTEGVRMMTVHAAKGLEFPVVILAEPTANASRTEPSHWVDPDRSLWVRPLAHSVPVELREREAEVIERDREESIRLTYVAATRARELLVVPAIADKRWDDTWTEVLYPALYPHPASAHSPREAPGCPKFGTDTVLDRQGPMPLDAPMPGLHTALTGKNGVVWWDPAVLQLGKEEKRGLQAADALRDDPVQGPKSQRDWFDWQDARRAAHDAGSVPSATVKVARELKEAPLPGVVSVESTTVTREGRPRGKRFGALVHASLAVVSLDADRPAISQVVAVQGRALHASRREVLAAIDAVESALQHPLFDRARTSRLKRECSVVDVLPDGTIVEGSVDLAFDDGREWTVVELKTDDDLTAHQTEYEAQTAAYVNAIAHATGKPARGVILRV